MDKVNKRLELLFGLIPIIMAIFYTFIAVTTGPEFQGYYVPVIGLCLLSAAPIIVINVLMSTSVKFRNRAERIRLKSAYNTLHLHDIMPIYSIIMRQYITDLIIDKINRLYKGSECIDFTILCFIVKYGKDESCNEGFIRDDMLNDIVKNHIIYTVKGHVGKINDEVTIDIPGSGFKHSVELFYFDRSLYKSDLYYTSGRVITRGNENYILYIPKLTSDSLKIDNVTTGCHNSIVL